jgi:hypothetical protein
MRVSVAIAVPVLLMALIFLLTIKGAYRSDSPRRPFFLYPLMGSFLLTSGFMVWGYHAVCTSRSSTAAIGLLFVPILSAVVAVVGFVVSWACVYVTHFTIQRIGGIPLHPISVVVLVWAIAVLGWAGNAAFHKILRHRLLNEAASGTDVESLGKIQADSIASRDMEVLSKLAKNPTTPVGDLVRMYEFCKPNFLQFNPVEYPVLSSLAQNHQTPPDILAALAACRQFSIRYAVAINPHTATETLKQLAEDQDDLVRTYAKSRLRSTGVDGKDAR